MGTLLQLERGHLQPSGAELPSRLRRSPAILPILDTGVDELEPVESLVYAREN